MEVEQNLRVSGNEVAIKDFKSVFYQMVGTPDNTTKVFIKDVVVDLNEIFLLNDLICEKLRTYEDAGFFVKVHVKYANRKDIVFSNWEDFKKYTWYENATINSIVLTWHFNAILPQYQVPQKHVIVVKLSNGMRPEEMLNVIFSGTIEDVGELEKSFFPVIASIDFIDRMLGDELLNIIGNWVDGLNESAIEKNKIILKLKKNKRKVAMLVEYVTYLISLIFSVVFLNATIDYLQIVSLANINVEQFKILINIIFIVVAIWILSKKLSEYLAKTIFNLLREYGDGYLFNITKGDKKKQDKMQKAEKYNRIRLVVTFTMAVAINIFWLFVSKIFF